MENPFLFAIALFESRKITTRLLASARENEPDFGVERDEPINWRLLVEDTARTEGSETNASNPKIAARSSDKEQDSNPPSLRPSVPQNPRTRTTNTRTKWLERLTRGSCA